MYLTTTAATRAAAHNAGRTFPREHLEAATQVD